MTAPAKPRTNTPARPMTGARPVSPRGSALTAGNGQPGPVSEFANDPFLRRLANPQDAERTKQSRRDIVEGLHVLTAQRERASIADDYYDGDVGMVYGSMQVRKLLAKQGMTDNEVQDFNYAKIPVDEIAKRLQIAAVKVAPVTSEEDAEGDEGDAAGADGPGDDVEGATGPRLDARDARGTGEASADPKVIRRAEKAIKLLRKNNRLDVYEKTLHKAMCKHGEAFLFLWPREDDRGKIVSVDFRVNTAHTVAFIYDPEDPLRVAYVIKSWETPSDFGEDGLTTEGRKLVTRANLYYPGPEQIDADGIITQGAGRVERWVTEPGAPATKPDSWKRVHEADNITDLEEVAADEFGDVDEPLDKDDIPAPYGLTWFHFRNDAPCGVPEHVSAYGPQTLINKLVWSLAGVIEYQGFPQRYIMVDPKIDDPLLNDVDPDHPEDEDDDPENETGTSGLRSDPNAVWRMFGKSTGQYSAADPDTFLKPLDRFIKSMAELTGQPLYAFTKNQADLPSGEAAREMNGQMIATVTDRQARADPEWQDAYELALRMLKIEGVSVDVRWVPPAPVNSLDGVEVLKGKRDLGVPGEVLLGEAGYPDDQIEKWLKSQEGMSLEQRISLLVQVGTAVQALAAGVTAGIVPDNSTSALIARILGNLAEGTADAPPSPDALPDPTFRDPPPTNPAMAAVEASQQDPLKRAQVEATKATAETSRASAEMMRSGAPGAPGVRGATRARAGQGNARKTVKAAKAPPAKAGRT